MSQNHQTCIDRVWGNLDDLDNAHNIWLKDLQQRRQTRHLSLVNPIHFISLHHQRCYMQVHVKQLDCWIITFFGQSNHFSFSLPPYPTTGGENGNRSIPTMHPNRWTPAAGWIRSCTEAIWDTRISITDNFPRSKKKAACGYVWLQLELAQLSSMNIEVFRFE